MRTPYCFFPIPLLIKHTLPSGLVKRFSILVSDIIEHDGTRHAKYTNGAEVCIPESRFIQLEMAQSDLSLLESTPLPDEVIRRDMLH